MTSTGNSSKQEAESFPLFWFIRDLKMRSTVWFWNNLEMSPFQYKADLLHLEASSFAWKSWGIHSRVCINKYLGILSFFFYFNTLNIISLVGKLLTKNIPKCMWKEPALLWDLQCEWGSIMFIMQEYTLTIRWKYTRWRIG